MSVYLSREFWGASLERATKTAAQGVGVGALTGTTLTDGHTLLAILLSAVAGFALSIVTSIASAQIGGNGPSLSSSEQLVPDPSRGSSAPSVDGA